MSISKKTIIMIICITIGAFLVMYLLSNYVYLQGFDDLERKTVGRSTQQVAEALSVKIAALDAFCYDWAAWDDTYYFAKGYNRDYVAKNLADDTFTTGDISLFLVVNTQGELVYGKAYDYISGKETALPEGLPGSLPAAVLAKTGGAQSAVYGITTLNGQPLIISARPVFTSLNEGPSTGSLIMGRFVDASLIDSISETTYLQVELLPLPEPDMYPELTGVFMTLSDTGEIYIETEEGGVISGYDMIEDIEQKPSFVLKVSIPRDIHLQGVRSMVYMIFSLIGIAIVFCFVFIYLIRHLVLIRLTSLSNAINAIGAKGDMSSRVSVKGKDELSRLAGNINNMLESLEKSEIRRQSQKEVISHIIANTPNSVLAFDESGYIALVNDAFRAAFDLKNRDITESKIEDIPEIADIVTEIKNFKASRETSLRKEWQFVSNGVSKIYIVSFARLQEEELYILYMTDISDERAKQESLYLTDRLASIGEMASGIAHELNNPLTSVIGLSEIVMQEEVPESIKEDMSLIKSESHRAAGIVRNLLSFARKNITLKQATNINKIIMDVLRLRSYEHGVNNIKVIQELDPQLPDIMVDNSQIQQVFINIILNAEYAMVNARGKGTLKIKTEVADDNVKVSFTDDGPGIEPQNIRRIFDPFFTTKEVGKGTGLGLSISYGIVTAHNGKIYAVSEFGKGTTFVIELPLHAADAKEAK